VLPLRLPCIADFDEVLQNLVEDALLEFVRLTGESQFEAFERKISSPGSFYPAAYPRPGRFVKSLAIELYFKNKSSPLSSNRMFSALVSILLQTSNLQSFDLERTPTLPAYLRSLPDSVHHQLVHLDITLGSDSKGVIPLINSFPMLQTLEIMCDPSTKDILQHEQPLILPNIRNFLWNWQGHCSPSHGLDFIAHCQFAACVEVSLFIAALKSTIAAHLVPFFQYHHLQSLTVCMRPQAMMVLKEHLMQIPQLSLFQCVPPAEMFASNKLPKSVKIAAGFDSQLNDLWKLFDNLLQHARKHPITEPLNIHLSFMLHDFDWIEMGRQRLPEDYDDEDRPTPEELIEEATFIGHMLYRALRLYKHNIIIYDIQGLTVNNMMDGEFFLAPSACVALLTFRYLGVTEDD
jgi:hypothetical protein